MSTIGNLTLYYTYTEREIVEVSTKSTWNILLHANTTVFYFLKYSIYNIHSAISHLSDSGREVYCTLYSRMEWFSTFRKVWFLKSYTFLLIRINFRSSIPKNQQLQPITRALHILYSVQQSFHFQKNHKDSKIYIFWKFAENSRFKFVLIILLPVKILYSINPDENIHEK